MPEKTKKTAEIREVSPVSGRQKNYGRKDLLKIFFEPGVKERRSNGW